MCYTISRFRFRRNTLLSSECQREFYSNVHLLQITLFWRSLANCISCLSTARKRGVIKSSLGRSSVEGKGTRNVLHSSDTATRRIMILTYLIQFGGRCAVHVATWSRGESHCNSQLDLPIFFPLSLQSHTQAHAGSFSLQLLVR